MAAVAAEAPAAPGQKVKPQKPDEEAFKANLAKAEKEHAAIQEKLVRAQFLSCAFSLPS